MKYMVTTSVGLTALVRVEEVSLSLWQAQAITHVLGTQTLSEDTPTGESPLIAASKAVSGYGVVKVEKV